MKYQILLTLLLSTMSLCISAADRLVVAGGSLTEIVYALGAEDKLVGVDSSSQYPAAARALPDIGYYRTLNVEGLLSVMPEHALMLKGSGPANVLAQLESLGVEITLLDNPKTIEGLTSLIQQVAKLTGKQPEGDVLIQTINKHIDDIAQQKSLDNKSAAFLMSGGDRGLMAAGKNTTPQLIFDTLTVTNPYAELEGFKPVSAESLAQNPPDLILIASHTTRGQTVDSLCASNQLKLWVSQKGCNLIKIDSLKFLGLTPRLPEAIAETREYLAD